MIIAWNKKKYGIKLPKDYFNNRQIKVFLDDNNNLVMIEPDGENILLKYVYQINEKKILCELSTSEKNLKVKSKADWVTF